MSEAEADVKKEGSNRAGSRKRVLFYLCVCLAVVLGGICFSIPYLAVENEITAEAGSEVPELGAFLRWDGVRAELVSGLNEDVDMNTVADQEVVIAVYGRIVNCILHVRDTKAPLVTTKAQAVLVNNAVEAADFVEEVEDATTVTVAFEEEPNWETAGIFEVALLITDEGENVTRATAMLEIFEDTEPPVISGVREITAEVGESISYIKGITVTDDYDEAVELVVDNSEVDLNTPGEYTVTYSAADVSGNTATVTTIVYVEDPWKDTEPPVISGVKEITAEVGGSISYKRGITVTDDYDEAVELVVDNSEVDLNTIGEYTVTYSATDASGNTTTVTTKVHVKAPAVETITEETINAEADKILASILTEGMTMYEQAEAIYWWCHDKIAYADNSAKDGYVQGAYQGLIKRKGDCYTYAMTAKCLLTRAGIPNMDIERIPSGNSMHYWNLIDVGEGWYHFDTTRRADGTTFFYMSDADITAYSDAHNNSHNYDRTKYPEIN